MDMTFKPKSTPRTENEPDLIKWWLLKGDKVQEFCNELDNLVFPGEGHKDVNANWMDIQAKILKAAEKVLGRTKGGKRISMETWWWSEPVRTALRRKKEAFKTWQSTKTNEDRQQYKQSKKEARQVIAVERSKATKELYASLEKKDGHKLIYKLAKLRNQATKDFVKNKILKGPDGNLVYNSKDILKTWHQYYDAAGSVPVERTKIIGASGSESAYRAARSAGCGSTKRAPRPHTT
ncbi:unnamed protein product [Danaus chrysippus]|uniref:(African queen) hypothetical protein n=1 Tax=Danaus chrysippus TaxID=151541 RepID=A0A8J2VSD8_9NEOP|nr:unnamed protein product [Danaus chrysippus]